MQRSGCNQPAKCHNNHYPAIFQPDTCQGTTAGNDSSAGSQQSRSPSQTSTTVSDALCIQETNTDTHHESLPNRFEKASTTLTPHSQGKSYQASLVSPQAEKKKRKAAITKAALERWQRWRNKVTVPPTLYPLARQYSVRTRNYWSLAMLCSAHIALQFCSRHLQKLEEDFSPFTSSFPSLCTILKWMLCFFSKHRTASTL